MRQTFTVMNTDQINLQNMRIPAHVLADAIESAVATEFAGVCLRERRPTFHMMPTG